jgi:hypothetical protein
LMIDEQVWHPSSGMKLIVLSDDGHMMKHLWEGVMDRKREKKDDGHAITLTSSLFLSWCWNIDWII